MRPESADPYPPEGLPWRERVLLAIRIRLPRALGGHRMVNNMRPSLWARLFGVLGRREWGAVAVLLILLAFFFEPFYARWASTQVAGSDVDAFLSMSDSDYDSLPGPWRYLLAGVAARPGLYSERLVEVLRHISPADVERVDALAPLVVEGIVAGFGGGSVAPFRDMPSYYRILSELESLGVVADASFGHPLPLRSSTNPQFESQLLGTSLGIAIIELRSSELLLSGFPLTDVGLELVGMLATPTDGRLMLWMAGALTGAGYRVEIWSVRSDDSGTPQLFAPLSVGMLAY